MSIQFKEPLKSAEWSIYQGKNFSVSIKNWTSQGLYGIKNRWNVYAHVYDTHPLFGNVDALLCLPFHRGATYDKLIITEPAQGLKYDFDKVCKVYKIGSDYAHCDDHYEDCGEADGIPPMIRHDAETLAGELFEWLPNAEGA
jgi:hypothetical protein